MPALLWLALQELSLMITGPFIEHLRWSVLGIACSLVLNTCSMLFVYLCRNRPHLPKKKTLLPHFSEVKPVAQHPTAGKGLNED